MAENTKRDSNKQKQGSADKPAGSQDRTREGANPNKTNPNKTTTPVQRPPDRDRQPQGSPGRMPADKPSVNDDLDLDLDDEDDRAAQRSPRSDRDDRA